jgi:glutamate--cysteine ligase
MTVTPLTESSAERHLAAHALTAAHPGFVGLAVDLPPGTAGPAGRSRLRHGFLIVEPGRVVVSGPPSPGLDIAAARMAEDLELAATLTGREAPGGRGVRVSLEAGTEDAGPTGLSHRWAVAHAIAPVLAASFASSAALDGPPAGPLGSPPTDLPTSPPATPRPVTPGGVPPTRGAADGTGDPSLDPRIAWARQVLDAPVSSLAPATFRDWIRHGHGCPPGIADLEEHQRAFRPPVAARGHLEIDVAARLPADGWLLAAAVISTLIEDPRAATEALASTADRRRTPYGGEHGTEAARSLFLSAYGALARRGAPRQMRDAVAAYLENVVLRGRVPAENPPIKENRS